ncbi:amidase [Amycolatopsis nigrescens]|uniref:amidase n=1 Tax=Amycolatopsis nigrescens TaxID=381445 RepID=UPI000363A9CA|nr:amidase [Amycolatopsis nigrescens]
MIDETRTLTGTARALRNGEVTSTGLTEAAIATADRLDGLLGVYLTRFDELAMQAAERADRELAAGLDRGPLQGIPFGVKDMAAMAEGPTTAQSLILERSWGAAKDAPVVTRLKAAGAVITGKTSLMEFGCGTPDETKPFPVPRNPWRPEHWAGGSSSGTAAGVASGMFAAGLGSDTGGSIRMPAAFCGVTGLMPTFGLVPKSGCVPMGFSLDRVGPLARSARDCAAVLEALAGWHASDPDSVHAGFTAPGFDGDLTGLRVGVVWEGHFPPDADPALASAFEAAVAEFTALGATPVEVSLPYRREMDTALFVISTSEALAYHRHELSRRWQDFFPATRGLVATGALFSGADYVQAQRVRRVAQDALAKLFTEVDVIACPTASVGAPALATLDHRQLYPLLNTPYWNSVGCPVLAVPMGFTGDGLPLSLQLAGPAFGEASILRAGDAFQRRTDWHLRTPAGIDAGIDAEVSR